MMIKRFFIIIIMIWLGFFLSDIVNSFIKWRDKKNESKRKNIK